MTNILDEVECVVPLTVREIRTVNPSVTVSITGLPMTHSNGDLKNLQRQDKDLSTIIAWLTLKYCPSKQELQMSSPSVRHLWQCNSQLEIRNDILFL